MEKHENLDSGILEDGQHVCDVRFAFLNRGRLKFGIQIRISRFLIYSPIRHREILQTGI